MCFLSIFGQIVVILEDATFKWIAWWYDYIMICHVVKSFVWDGGPMGYLRNQHLDIEKDSRSKALFPLSQCFVWCWVNNFSIFTLRKTNIINNYSLKKKLEDYFPFEKAYLQGLF